MLLSLDVAFENIGYSIFNERKLIKVGLISAPKFKGKFRKTDERIDRCSKMSGDLMRLIFSEGIQGIIAEIPSGSQNATAANLLGWASALVVSTSRVLDIPMEHVTQRDVKLAVMGTEKATKDQIMDRMALHYKWEKKSKIIKITKGKRKGKDTKQVNYFPFGLKYPKGKFEHIADSIGVYWASQDRNLVRMFG